MRVNLVLKPSGGWILERMAHELSSRLSGVTVNAGRDVRHADQGADVNYYLPARDFTVCPCAGRAIALYTHGSSAFDLIGRFDQCLAMNTTMAATLRREGAASVAVVRPGVDAPVRGPIVFGVIGRVYNSGRKGAHLVEAAVRAGFTVIGCAPDHRIRAMARRQWPCPTPYTIDQRAEFYQAIDYLLVTSTLEGGPITVIEAIAHGVPVIAPAGVGWCDEFPCLGRYAAGEWESLEPILRSLTAPPTWAAWAEDHRGLFARLAEVAA